MQNLDTTALAAVLGGTSSTSITVGPLSTTRTTSDYRTCVDAVTEQTARLYPSTKPWWNPFATDRNAGPRAAATIDNLRSVCGQPEEPRTVARF